jgi:hypothetical protein
LTHMVTVMVLMYEGLEYLKYMEIPLLAAELVRVVVHYS